MIRLQTKACFAMFVAAALIVPGLTPASAGMWDAISQFKKPNLRMGQLEVNPYYNLSETYDSNIYLVPQDQPNGVRVGGGVRGSWITGNNLGLKLSLPLSEMHKFDLKYDLDHHAYATQPGPNNTLNQAVDFGYHYKGPQGVKGNIKDDYLNTTDPAFSELVQRNRRWQNAFGVDGEYAPGGNFYGGVNFGQTTHKYLDPTLSGLLNRYEQSFGLTGGYQLQPKTRIYAGYSRGITHYTDGRSANSKSHGLNFGITGDIAPKLTGQIQTGMAYRSYDASSANPNQTQVTRNWQVETKLTYKPLERTTMRLGLTRAVQEATLGNNRFYISSNANLSVIHKLPYKLTANANFGWGVDKYSETSTLGGITAVRRDDNYQEGLGLDYNIQEWLKTGISYTHRERDSIFSGQFNYVDHVTALSLSLMF